MKLAKSLLIASAVSGLIATSSFANDLVAEGKKIFTTKKLGNCVACHAVMGDSKVTSMGPGSFGPDLSATQYYPADLLYNSIYDIYSIEGKSKANAMPAFGKNGLLNDKEIKALVAYLQSEKK
jgi:sulfur-oxidizing protein SoxX